MGQIRPTLRSTSYKRILRPAFFHLDPELVHDLALAFIGRLGGLLPQGRIADPRLVVNAWHLRFANPLGLAAGFDKDGVALQGLGALGFGHIEAGTVTPQPQPGNPKPRIFRLIDDRGLINRMGFPNKGWEPLHRNLTRARPCCTVGINIGKGKDTPIERAFEDYAFLFDRFHDLADYVAVNVSSPNTVGLRQLQARTLLTELLSHLVRRRSELQSNCPILVKIAPDLTTGELDDILEAGCQAGIDGIVATNTTLERPPLRSGDRYESGGLSGKPLGPRATEVIRHIYSATGGKLPIIGVGGVFDAADVLEKIKAGAKLVQVYTGFIYEGPWIVSEINRGLVDELDRQGARSIVDLVGTESSTQRSAST